uniref:Putative secreted peptide n=1 Tax=Anopheles braziliensis TaxID=58242 RepID=A0A2M3ZTY9_9DIPT
MITRAAFIFLYCWRAIQPRTCFCSSVTMWGIMSFRCCSSANSVWGDRINILVRPKRTSFVKFFSFIRTFTPSRSLPPRKLGQVYCEIIL